MHLNWKNLINEYLNEIDRITRAIKLLDENIDFSEVEETLYHLIIIEDTLKKPPLTSLYKLALSVEKNLDKIELLLKAYSLKLIQDGNIEKSKTVHILIAEVCHVRYKWMH